MRALLVALLAPGVAAAAVYLVQIALALVLRALQQR
jgi:hypothetical protein